MKLKSLRLIDFRSFENEDIQLENVTVIVGANNVGKSNILRALELFSPEVNLDTSRDKRRSSSRSTPELVYELELEEDKFFGRIGFTIPKKFLVKKTDTGWDLSSEDGSNLETPLQNNEYFKNSTGADIAVDKITVKPEKIVLGSLLNDELKQQFTPLSAEELPGILKSEVNQLVRGQVPNVRNVWAPTEDQDFISEDNPIDQVISNPDLPLSQLLSNAFQKDPSVGNYQEVLQKGVASETETFCQNVTEVVNNIFKENWSFKPPIKLKISPRDASLKVWFDQGRAGHLEPSFSSDGLIWLISFFIRLGMAKVENSLILLDQPGDKLYPGGQKDLVRIIESLGEKNQVIYTTHSPFMITQRRLGRNVRLVSKVTDSNGNQIGSSKINNEIKQTDIRQSELLTTALGFSWTDFVPVGDFNVLMEGKLDSAVVINTERQKSIRKGSADIDFSRVVVRGMGRASYINDEAKRLKVDGKRTIGIFDADFQNSTPDLDTNEKIKLEDIDSSWSDIEDLIPKEFFKKIFQELTTQFSKPFQYTTRLDGPGRGKKIKEYLKRKATEIGLEKESLINLVEMKMVDLIEKVSEGEEELPKSFYDLNKEIIKKLQ